MKVVQVSSYCNKRVVIETKITLDDSFGNIRARYMYRYSLLYNQTVT